MMILFVLAFLATAAPVGAADVVVKSTDTSLSLVEYFLKVPTSEADPKYVPPFLEIDPKTLPRKYQRKTIEKQIEIKTLIKLHDEKKSGSIVMPLEGCSEKDFVLPLEQAETYLGLGYEEINEDELKYVMDRTRCTTIDLGCRFSLKIFFKKKKDRRLMFVAQDPIMSLVAQSHGKGGQTNFFGASIGCMR